MSFGRKSVFFGVSAAIAFTASALPMSTGFAFESDDAVSAEADELLLAEAGIAADAATAEEPTIALGNENAISIEEAAAQAEAIIEQAEEANAERDETAVAINDSRDAELQCLAKVILHEARGEPREGQLAVAQVVMNRVESSRFPNSICGVIYQRSQFSNIRSYSPRRSGAHWENAIELAIDARNGISEPVIGEALYFHASRIRPAFARRLTRVRQIGNHVFLR